MKSTRKLAWGDTFRFARIIKAGRITPTEIYELTIIKNRLQTSAEGEKAQEEMGVHLFGYILEKFPDCETPLNSFLASMAGVKTEEIEKADITEIIELIADIIKNNKDIKDFFIQAFKSASVMPLT